MNILRIADSVSTLFSKKVNITLIDTESKRIISKHVLDESSLPKEFNRPTILRVEDSEWRILEVDLINSGNYFKPREISFHVIAADKFTPTDKYLIPTLTALIPNEELEGDNLFSDFVLPLTSEKWLQLEFISFENISFVQETISIIDTLINSPDDSDNLRGYSSVYIRDTIYDHQLEISFNEFCAHVNPIKKGSILYAQNSPIKKGFSLKSENYTYYGIVDNGTIKKLALHSFECVDDEICGVVERFKLIFIDWCNASIIS